MSSDLSARKSALRAIALQRRSAAPAEVRAHLAERLAKDVAAFAVERHFRSVAVFMPVRGEPDCLLLSRALHAAKIVTLLPAVRGGPGTALSFREWTPGGPLVPGPIGGIPEPPATRREWQPDLIVTPCAGFDREGGRLGYGRGYYDATLAHLRAQGAVVAVAAAFACQEVDHVPMEAHDERLDGVLTEREFLFFTSVRKALDAAAVHR